MKKVETKGSKINKTYPMTGYRMDIDSHKQIMEWMAEAEAILLKNPDYKNVKITRNKIFFRALEIGFAEIKKKKIL